MIVFDFGVDISLIPLRMEMTSSDEYCRPEIGCGINILILDIFFLKYISSSFDLLIVIGRRTERFFKFLSFDVDLGEIEFSIRINFLVLLDLFSSVSFFFFSYIIHIYGHNLNLQLVIISWNG